MIALASVSRAHAAPGTELQMEITVEAVRHKVRATSASCRSSIRREKRRLRHLDGCEERVPPSDVAKVRVPGYRHLSTDALVT